MPLSEQEQRLLEEMERSLYHNDADFVATVGSRRGRPSYRSVVVGILLGVVGVAVIVTGVVLHQPIIGIAGFVVMFVGVLMAFSSPKRGIEPEDVTAQPAARKPRFMDRMNERWDKRQNDHDE
ncbi:MAG TPA: DUF3040 domain-containing protein [Lacisediminihabitans sp.]|uniref:DUF3040 domain-containing protein n=1 Tax=Lacisediminihabitans sp. TaxID=2787631 RepID=UPI002EDB2BDB